MTSLIPLQVDALLYAVWIPGSGWLRGSNERIFASDRREIAESAARLYAAGSFVTEFDGEAMIDLEKTFVEKERERSAQALRSRGKIWRMLTRS